MRGRSEGGAATAHAASIAVLLTTMALVMTQAAGLVRLRHSVAAAADLSALAASRASVDGADGCQAAKLIARRNDAKVLACHMDFDVATITARGTSRTWWGHRWAFEQKARAAPTFYLGSTSSGGASASNAFSNVTAPALLRGSLPLPHFGDCTHDGHPVEHSQATMASRVTRSHRAATS